MASRNVVRHKSPGHRLRVIIGGAPFSEENLKADAPTSLFYAAGKGAPGTIGNVMDTQKIKIYKDGEVARPDLEPGRNVLVALVRKGELKCRFGRQTLIYGKGTVTMLNFFPEDGMEAGEGFRGYVLSLPSGMLYGADGTGMLNDGASHMDGISLSDSKVRTLSRYLTLICNSCGNHDSPFSEFETDCLCRAFLAKCRKLIRRE